MQLLISCESSDTAHFQESIEILLIRLEGRSFYLGLRAGFNIAIGYGECIRISLQKVSVSRGFVVIRKDIPEGLRWICCQLFLAFMCR